jgi:hypothetical protein
MPDQLWTSKISIIMQQDKLTEFFPDASQTTEEKLNSIVRFSLYTSIILAAYFSDIRYLGIFIGTLAITAMLDNTQSISVDTIDPIVVVEGMDPSLNITTECTKPTLANPFMNFTMADYLNLDKDGRIKDRSAACDINNPEIKKEADSFFNQNLYRDVSDVFGKVNSQREFYTMPSTTFPNDRETFQNWLYLSPKTCKEDSNYCVPLVDLRNQRQIFPHPEVDPVVTKV